MNIEKILGLVVSIGVIVYLIIVYRSPEMLIPAGYELAIDGYVISKNLILSAICILIAQLGFVLMRTSFKK